MCMVYSLRYCYMQACLSVLVLVVFIHAGETVVNSTALLEVLKTSANIVPATTHTRAVILPNARYAVERSVISRSIVPATNGYLYILLIDHLMK